LIDFDGVPITDEHDFHCPAHTDGLDVPAWAGIADERFRSFVQATQGRPRGLGRAVDPVAFAGLSLGACFRLAEKESRTVVIEVGMQNAAQAIAIATSPFIFNNEKMAIPAIIYALLMNVVLLVYVKIKAKSHS